ncbi:ArsR/SmtB family transcription factor [Aquisalinus flavus]|uniref:Transcriptional regulator n=1 Tax=Aquisalinus flavus TaxID=1526572 RepID=A0A8J2V695_9PROT|nr:metalloregulator ArsR/SmtB family transcription factor [Aquisalinus flavus]MBD0425499.1 winged helix-turn-helix transcriptional regulator [Aquisalinus flavus]UNE48869.1 winged helix-turn-helix transcriptional regulator [Aquisalinus flavus]GGD15607.1 transcriptional regulator [Aquisalinus flavus]
METKLAVNAFAALSQETRLDIFRLLIKAGTGGQPAGALAEALGIAASTLSFHLKELEHAGLVTSARDGRRIFYKADYAGIREVIDFLMADCCNGDPRLCGPYIVTRTKEECC